MKKKKPRIVVFVILSVITLVTWVVFDIYRIFTRPSPVELEPEVLEGISPTLNQDVISEIENRIFFSDDQVRGLIKTQGGQQ